MAPDMNQTNPSSAEPETSTMDVERQRRNVRHYVYRLHEVRNWLAECLGESSNGVPVEPIELEEVLRSGVLLAKLANYFAPNLVPNEKIFDADETRLAEHGFHYRHTDNINLWRQACISFELREIILPDPSDVFAGRNVRTIFALIALAHRLYLLRKSPPIRDQTGNVLLTEDDYKLIGERIGLSGGNFAGSHLQTVAVPDQLDIQSTVQAINEALANFDKPRFRQILMEGRHILHVDPESVDAYFDRLHESRTEGPMSLDEIQALIIEINRRNALALLHLLLDKDELDRHAFSQMLLSMHVGDGRVLEACLSIYADELRKLRTGDEQLAFEQVERVVRAINSAAMLPNT